METWMWVVIAVAAVVVIAAVAFWLWDNQRRKSRSERLQNQFGDEYDRTVDRSGRKSAEAELMDRQQRVEQMNIRPLSDAELRRFADRWHSTQADFVDEPGGAVAQADRLVGEVMQTRGYPVGDFEQRAADVSVDHPTVVQNYRAAHALAVRHQRAQASTEDLRQAMMHYRALFTDLLETEDGVTDDAHVH
jgi:FtsZ-interacting cell division protein ZipA